MKRAKLLFNHVFPDFKFEYAEAKTLVSVDEFQRLTQHEKKAIERELSNLRHQYS